MSGNAVGNAVETEGASQRRIGPPPTHPCQPCLVLLVPLGIPLILLPPLALIQLLQAACGGSACQCVSSRAWVKLLGQSSGPACSQAPYCLVRGGRHLHAYVPEEKRACVCEASSPACPPPPLPTSFFCSRSSLRSCSAAAGSRRTNWSARSMYRAVWGSGRRGSSGGGGAWGLRAAMRACGVAGMLQGCCRVLLGVAECCRVLQGWEGGESDTGERVCVDAGEWGAGHYRPRALRRWVRVGGGAFPGVAV